MRFYIVRYIYFIKTSNKSLMLYLTNNDINCLAINKFLIKNILFNLSGI